MTGSHPMPLSMEVGDCYSRLPGWVACPFLLLGGGGVVSDGVVTTKYYEYPPNYVSLKYYEIGREVRDSGEGRRPLHWSTGALEQQLCNVVAGGDLQHADLNNKWHSNGGRGTPQGEA